MSRRAVLRNGCGGPVPVGVVVGVIAILVVGAAVSAAEGGGDSLVRFPIAATSHGTTSNPDATRYDGPLSAPIMKALDRSTVGLRVFDLDNGGTGVDLDGRFLHVMGVTAHPEGTFETWCVDNPQAAEKLLRRPAAKAATTARGRAAASAADPPGAHAKFTVEVSGTLGLDPSRLAGADELGRMLLYAPDPLEQGSSISHWDRSAAPDLLMEPSVSRNVVFGDVDLTLSHFRDLGWPVGSSTITIRVTDAAGQGFNDATVVPAAPGNPGGTTLGGQRLAALEWAADVWASLLRSSVEINIASSFDELDCDPDDGAVLAAAGARYLYADFTSAPRAGTWYHGALAEALAGENLSASQDGAAPNDGDVAVTFNSDIDEGCLAPSYSFYYGLDGPAPAGQASFAMVALHEIAHGLGFSSFVNSTTGNFPIFSGVPRLPDIYSVFTYDADIGLRWDVMTAAERRESAVNTGDLVWDGPFTTAAAPGVLDGAPRLNVSSPGWVAGSYSVQTAQFGPPLTLVGVSGNLAVARDGSDDPTLACGPLANTAEVTGKIALIDRGSCLFTEKVKNAQNAGAVAVLIVNNLPQGLPPMGGSDPTVTIPAVGISRADGSALKSALRVGAAALLRAGGRVAVSGVP